MKLSKYAKLIGVSYRTAYNYYKRDLIPFEVEQLDTGTILVHATEAEVTHSQEIEVSSVHLYARVSSHDQKDDCTRQLQRMRDFCASSGYVIASESMEIASGMNQNRKKLNKLLADKNVKTIIVEHRDRLTRFNFELIKSTLNASGRDIIVINETSEDMDIVQDFIDVITSMCSRIYGLRSGKNKTQRMKEILSDEMDVRNEDEK